MWKFCCTILLVALASSAGAVERAYSGQTIVRTISPTRLAVFVDSNSDAVIDKGFLLTTDVPMSAIAFDFAEAKLRFTEGYVRIEAGDKVFDLQLAGYPDSPAAAASKEVVTVIGSALQQSKGDSGCTLERAYRGDASVCYSYGE